MLNALTGSQVAPTFQMVDVSGRNSGLPEVQVLAPIMEASRNGSLPENNSPQLSLGIKGRAWVGVGARKLSPHDARNDRFDNASQRSATLGVVASRSKSVKRSWRTANCIATVCHTGTSTSRNAAWVSLKYWVSTGGGEVISVM